MAQRRTVSSDSAYESVVGYSRAVRTGPHIAVAGTTGDGDGIAAQTRQALRRIEIALQQAGGSLSDVVRTPILITDISQWEESGVHAEVFSDIRPVAAIVQVAALISADLLVEIEVDASLDA